MFAYPIKTKVILILILLAIIAGIFIIVRYNFSRSRDLVLVNQVKILADSLERYYDKFHTYPITTKISVEQIEIISSNGLNQTGDIVYFMPPAKWIDSASLISDGNNYYIDFNLSNSWPLWNLVKGGGICRVSTGIQMQCVSR